MPPPANRLVSVGDAHLGAVPREVEEAFLAFLDGVPDQGDGLLVNGDLFDFWFAYRRAVPRAGIRVVARLAAVARRIPVWMTGGNHDRWAGSFWDQELGIHFAPEELYLRLGPGSVLAVHGDGVAEARWAGRMIHRVSRHPLTTATYRLLHPDAGLWLVQRFSRHLADPGRDAACLDRAALLQREWATRRLRDAGDISLLIMGHTHRPALEEPFPGRRYLNPGAWLDGLRYAVATETTAELRQFRG